MVALLAVVFLAAGVQAQEIDAKKLLAQPKAYVGSEVCRTCHLEHYDAWKRTLHSRMLQDAKANQDVIIPEIDEKTIRSDLALKEDKLKVPSAEIYVPKVDEILYTIGSQWKQRFLIKRGKEYFITPIQFNPPFPR
mgnify:FL=1|tara:strand:+ start:406 stop:813 length:408 start_codon:yes stop_codon:yes gene_type:complete